MNHSSRKVYLSLGTNLGDKNKNLLDAIKAIEILPDTRVVESSSIWETAAWGKTDQDDFLNQVILIETIFSANELMENILAIEKNLGRIRKEHWGPRIIDIDILFYNNEIMNTVSLTIPHPEIQNRKFVLAPLHEIAADFIHPVLKKTIGELLYSCADKTLCENKIALN